MSMILFYDIVYDGQTWIDFGDKDLNFFQKLGAKRRQIEFEELTL